MYAIEDKMIAAGFEGKVKERHRFYMSLYLSEYAGDASFVSKLVGCFAADQTDEQLISAVNAAFGTNLDADDLPLSWSTSITRLLRLPGLRLEM